MELVKSGAFQFVTQVQSLSFFRLLPDPLLLPAHFDQVILVRVLVRFPVPVVSIRLVDPREPVPCLGPDLEVHSPLEVQIPIRLAKRVP